MIDTDSPLAQLLKNSALGRAWQRGQSNLRLREEGMQDQAMSDALARPEVATEAPMPETGGTYRPLFDLRPRNMQAESTTEQPSEEDLAYLMQDEMAQEPEAAPMPPIPQAPMAPRAQAMQAAPAMPAPEAEMPSAAPMQPEAAQAPLDMSSGLGELLARRRENIKNARMVEGAGQLGAGLGTLLSGGPTVMQAPDTKRLFEATEDELEDYNLKDSLEKRQKDAAFEAKKREQEITKIEKEMDSQKSKEDPNSEVSELYRFLLKELSPNMAILPTMTAAQIEQVIGPIKDIARARMEQSRMEMQDRRLEQGERRLSAQEIEADRRAERAGRVDAPSARRISGKIDNLHGWVRIRSAMPEFKKRAGILDNFMANARRAVNMDSSQDSALRDQLKEQIFRVMSNSPNRMTKAEIDRLVDTVPNLWDRGNTFEAVLNNLLESDYAGVKGDLDTLKATGRNVEDIQKHLDKTYSGENIRNYSKQREQAEKNFKELGSTSGELPAGKVMVSNGQKTFVIDEAKLAEAEKDGFRRLN